LNQKIQRCGFPAVITDTCKEKGQARLIFRKVGADEATALQGGRAKKRSALQTWISASRAGLRAVADGETVKASACAALELLCAGNSDDRQSKSGGDSV
jgi:NCAIR mutase (PurE)-related protein